MTTKQQQRIDEANVKVQRKAAVKAHAKAQRIASLTRRVNRARNELAKEQARLANQPTVKLNIRVGDASLGIVGNVAH